MNFNIFWGFQKTEYFWGYEDFLYIFWGNRKIGLYLEVISMHLRVKVQNEEYFLVAKISNIYLGCFKSLIFFWVNSRWWARAYI